MLPNHSITFCVFLHWFTCKIVLKWVFTLSKISLLIFPELLFAGLISRHFGLFSKFSSWSLREIKASRFFMHSIRLPIESLSAMCFSSLLISEMLSSDPCLYVFVMLSCKTLLWNGTFETHLAPKAKQNRFHHKMVNNKKIYFLHGRIQKMQFMFREKT